MGGPPGVGSNVTQPTPSRATSAHWWAWSVNTVCGTPVRAIDHPETTLAGIPAARDRSTKALLKEPAVPCRVIEQEPVDRIAAREWSVPVLSAICEGVDVLAL